jgi:hypothetical protein
MRPGHGRPPAAGRSIPRPGPQGPLRVTVSMVPASDQPFARSASD